MRIILLCLVSACAATIGPNDSPDGPDPSTFGVLVTPRLGSVVEGSTASASLSFQGVYVQPDAVIEIQVLDAGAWQPIASATTSSQPSSEPSLYEWKVIATPAALAPARWPQGGLLYVRALGPTGVQLAGLFHDADACLSQAADWRARASACGGVFPLGTVIVSPADIADGAARPRYLDQRGFVDETETRAYYAAIDAPPTVDDFRARFGIEDASARAVYYNAGDLGIGRDMRCVPQLAGQLACTVENYGTFSGSVMTALDDAVDHETPFATVAMVYTPPASAPNSVQFIVYDAGGALTDRVQLDEFGDNQAIPNSCLNCHGSAATYNPATHAVVGGAFLPFDPESFVFSNRSGYTASEQASQLTVLNELVQDAGANPAIRPAGWSQTALDRAVYQHLVSSCRGCHASRTDRLAFSNPEDFRHYSASIVTSVCNEHDMPNAQVALARLWRGPARAYLASYLDTDACSP